jgi:hypothetical protein
MGKLVLGVATLALSAGAASAQVLRTLWLRLRGYGPTLQLRNSRIRLRGIRLRSSRLRGTGHSRNDRCYRDARRSGLHSTNRGFAVAICLRTRLLGRIRWIRLGRIRALGCRVLVALKTAKSGSLAQAAATERKPARLCGA